MHTNKKYKIIITGATGFIGKRLIELLPKYYNKKNVLCLVWDKENIQEIESRKYIKNLGVAVKKVNLVTKKGLDNLPTNPTLIIHLAANTHTSANDHRINDIGTMNLYNAFGTLDHKTHFIHASTVAMFAGRSDCNKPLNENHTYDSTNKYGRTKQRAEEFLINKAKINKFRLSCPRITTVYGKYARPDSMFPMLKNKIKNNSFTTRIDWPGIASFIHVDDCAKMILELSKKKTEPGIAELFFLYTESFSTGEVTKLMYEAMNTKYRPVIVPKFIWSILRLGKIMIPISERILSSSLYNWVWRFGLLIENATWCQTKKIEKFIPRWKYKTLRQSMSEIIA